MNTVEQLLEATDLPEITITKNPHKLRGVTAEKELRDYMGYGTGTEVYFLCDEDGFNRMTQLDTIYNVRAFSPSFGTLYETAGATLAEAVNRVAQWYERSK